MRAIQTVKTLIEKTFAARGMAFPENAEIAPPKDSRFGDLSCNAALIAAKTAGEKPRDLATRLAAAMTGADAAVESVEVAGPGFLNFRLSPAFWRGVAGEVLDAGAAYGTSAQGAGTKVMVEFVSANPTGPLHIGHGRGAALGDSLARILAAAGYAVTAEYYVNDAGRQMRLLGDSIWARYQSLCGRQTPLPEDGYQGDYIIGLAGELKDIEGDALLRRTGDEARDICRRFGTERISQGIREDLEAFGVRHDQWFSELSLVHSGVVERTLEDLRAKGLAYDSEGALWFDSQRFGDDKNRVLVKSGGELTYFASDIAYHADKYARGFELLVDIWGADHHGYVPRLKAAAAALGRDPGSLQCILVQLVSLTRAGERIAMSTRAGKFETLRDVIDEVGADAARFIFLSRKSDSQLDFDLDLVKRQTMENPVYYVQYAHARICSLMAKAAERGVGTPDERATDLSRLDTAEDFTLLKHLEQYPDVVATAARTLSPHLVSFYLRDLAGTLHRYYTVSPVLAAPEAAVRDARMVLLRAVARVLANGLDLLGVGAPRRMERAAEAGPESGDDQT